MSYRLALFSVALFVCCVTRAETGSADIALSKLFSDHMVLQRNKSVSVWGTADPEEKLTIKFANQTAAARADSRGRWSTLIKTGAAGGPFQLEVSVEGSETKIVVSNIMVGEVWICAGQSNMEWPLSQTTDSETEIADAKNYPNLRLFTVEHHAVTSPQHDFAKVKPWACCAPESVKDFSAVAYFFGRELSKKLQVPIGLVNSSWGGTRCEAWTSVDSLTNEGSFDKLLKHWSEQPNPTHRHRVGNLFNGMVSPLIGFPFKGVIWYQGEANVGRGDQYRRLFPTMINDWRKSLNNEEFPFYFVQLAPYRYKDQSIEALPEVWDAQLATMRSVPNTGMVVTTDIGNVSDIHPRNKKEVGRRLSLWVLSKTYVGAGKNAKSLSGEKSNGKPVTDGSRSETTSPDSNKNDDNAKQKDGDSAEERTFTSGRQEQQPQSSRRTPPEQDSKPSVESASKKRAFSGPIYKSMKVVDGKIRLKFDYANGMQTTGDQPLTHFTICGKDQKFAPAIAKIEGDEIVVHNPGIAEPVAVRFAWEDTAVPNLFNSDGLPASPFRTDKFDLSSKGVEF